MKTIGAGTAVVVLSIAAVLFLGRDHLGDDDPTPIPSAPVPTAPTASSTPAPTPTGATPAPTDGAATSTTLPGAPQP